MGGGAALSVRSRWLEEHLMVPRLALCFGAAVAAALAIGMAEPAWSQSKPAAQAPAAPAAPAQAPAAPAAPAAPIAPAPSPAPATTQPGDPFGEETTLAAKPIVFVKGTGNWDTALATITGSLKKLRAYVDKEGLKTDGLPMTVFTQTDDSGFQYQAAIPLTEMPKAPARADILTGQSPEGRALKFVHRGSYDELDNTYEAITNYLDDKRLEAKDMFIEEYVTDPSTTDAKKLVVNVFVLIK
jgi:effector-binding domain-containing protein